MKEAEPKGFDAFDLRLGDLMRGERATMGKSLLDVERELRIKASYVAAIENADPDAFDTPGFIPGYVRSYARYLGMDPDEAFKTFCAESGFSIAHGMSAEASSIRKHSSGPVKNVSRREDPFASAATPFAPAGDGFLSRVEPGAVGSVLVLAALIGAIGYGGWTVLNEVQRVQFAPVENTPDVLADLDPLSGALGRADEDPTLVAAGAFQPPADERLDRLYRPEALDVPVMIARDAPISTLDPAHVGTLSAELPQTDRSSISAALTQAVEPQTPQVVADPLPGVMMVAVRPAWVRVRGADGSVVFEGIMNSGDTYKVAATEEAPTLRAGESGAIYFLVNGQHYGPVGPTGSVTSGLPLDAEMLTDALAVADLNVDVDLKRYVELQLGAVPQE